MADHFSASTRAELLEKLRDAPEKSADPTAWNEFVEQYTPMILGWCRWRHQQEADVEAIHSDVMLILLEKMPSFRYDPSKSFRGWLMSVVFGAAMNYIRTQRKPGIRGSGGPDNPAEYSAPEHSTDTTDERIEVLTRAMATVQATVEPDTWAAFVRTAIDGEKPSTVADSLKVKPNVVYLARSRVQKKIYDEVVRLRPDLAASEPPSN